MRAYLDILTVFRLLLTDTGGVLDEPGKVSEEQKVLLMLIYFILISLQPFIPSPFFS